MQRLHHRDAGDGILDSSERRLGKKHPATLDGVKVREEAAPGEITPAPRDGSCRDSASSGCEPADKNHRPPAHHDVIGGQR